MPTVELHNLKYVKKNDSVSLRSGMDQKDSVSVNADDKSSPSSPLMRSSMTKPGEKYTYGHQYPFIWRTVNLVMVVFLLLCAYVQVVQEVLLVTDFYQIVSRRI